MDDLIALVEVHGVLAVFVVLFLKRMGVPVPALPFLLLAGAKGANDGVFLFVTLAAATIASVLADGIWFLAGRRYGRSVLSLVCRISISPGTCISKSELNFARRGQLTVLLAKFIPGVAGLAPPLAGALGMRTANFTLLNFAGTVLWAGSGLAAGLIFREQVGQLLRWLQRLGSAALPFIMAAFALYIGWLAVRRLLVNREARKASSIEPQLLAEMMARGDPVLLIDVRGAGALGDARIPGAIHAPLRSEKLDGLSHPDGNGEFVTYCDCPDDISAVRAALDLKKRGLRVRVLAGGIPAWVAAGLPVDSELPSAMAVSLKA